MVLSSESRQLYTDKPIKTDCASFELIYSGAETTGTDVCSDTIEIPIDRAQEHNLTIATAAPSGYLILCEVEVFGGKR